MINHTHWLKFRNIVVRNYEETSPFNLALMMITVTGSVVNSFGRSSNWTTRMEPDRTANLTKIEQTSDQKPPFLKSLPWNQLKAGCIANCIFKCIRVRRVKHGSIRTRTSTAQFRHVRLCWRPATNANVWRPFNGKKYLIPFFIEQRWKVTDAKINWHWLKKNDKSSSFFLDW